MSLLTDSVKDVCAVLKDGGTRMPYQDIGSSDRKRLILGGFISSAGFSLESWFSDYVGGVVVLVSWPSSSVSKVSCSPLAFSDSRVVLSDS